MESVVNIEANEHATIATLQCATLTQERITGLLSDIIVAASHAPRSPVLLDLSQLQEIGSLGLGTLSDLHSHLTQEDQALLITGINPRVRQALEITQLDQLFRIHESRDDALEFARTLKA